MDNIAEGARIHKILSNDHKNKIGSLRKPDGTHSRNEKETLELLNSVHSPGSSLMSDRTSNETSNPADFESALRIFTEEKVRWSVSSFSAFKSPGVDGIFPGLLQARVN